ncbi:flavin reductase family protein [Methanococcus maripaludis]|uniref:Flavin reductase (DIM6/NTAB) family NADH-FMN oxidoreductase RutF n=2 Tax=Methanococcus maripaludis TaxID=39152 RepID=A0A7J9PHG3_METMI|nr:flavin reductase family protein [Methanococcus maripaludis]MBA2862198.1 flavin reductase (DIM6/NTAB) family NADH-FMN oxidoreductase RutF [Methanococcus maripaludis]
MIFKSFLRAKFIPLPVGFISTISKDGIRNIAPYSCLMPVLRPLDLVCLASAKKRDTLTNIKDTGEFVINMPGIDFSEKVMPTAKFSRPEVDEFVDAELEEKPSSVVKAPGIAGSYAWMECELHKLYEEEDYVLIVGKVVNLDVDDKYLKEDGSLDVEKANPLMNVGNAAGLNYCTVSETGKFDPISAMFPNGKDPAAKN